MANDAGAAPGPDLPAGSTLRARWAGDRALLLECVTRADRGALPGTAAEASAAEMAAAVSALVHELRAAIAVGELEGVVELVPAARTVLLRCADSGAVERARVWAARRPWWRRVAVMAEAEAEVETVTSTEPLATSRGATVIDVSYDGEDLAAVSAALRISPEALVAAHTGASWQAAFGGFAPGFMYLTAPEWSFRVPRLDAPRTRVPAGSVAIAGEFSAVYPAPSPGGWQLIGRTTSQLWSLDRAEPALVLPGDRVQFRAVQEQIELHGRAAPAAQPESSAQPEPSEGPSQATLTVLQPGMLTLIQDLGRDGFRAVGVTGSGAMDRDALALANAAVGNDVAGSGVGAAALEAVGGGLELLAEREVRVAIAGTAAELVVIDAAGLRRTVPAATAATLRPGDRLLLSPSGPGIREYLAFAGGVDTAEQLGSRSSDTLSGLGPRALAAGDALIVGHAGVWASTDTNLADDGETVAAAIVALHTRAEAGEVVRLRFVPGPRADWFAPGEMRAFAGSVWRVGVQSDRVGTRIEGPALKRAVEFSAAELASEGMVRGAIQVPPDGQPVLFQADHPVTGGYPVIGVVIDADLDRAGQLAPGTTVQFEPVQFEAVHHDALQPDAVTPGGAKASPHAAVSCTLEVDGKRASVMLPHALAAAIDATLDGLGVGESPESAAEVVKMLLGAIRNDTTGRRPETPAPPRRTE